MKLNVVHRRLRQLYFEEAHTLFPLKDDDIKNIYANIMKMAGKLGIGIVYPRRAHPRFVEFRGRQLFSDTCRWRSGVARWRMHSLLERNLTWAPGYLRVLTHSRRIAVPVQVTAPGKDR